jgi:hypothetical protein
LIFLGLPMGNHPHTSRPRPVIVGVIAASHSSTGELAYAGRAKPNAEGFGSMAKLWSVASRA